MIDQGSPLTERALFVTGNIVTSLHYSTTLVVDLLTLHNEGPLIGKRIVLLGVCTYVCLHYGMYNNIDRNRFGKQNARELWYGTTDRGGRRSHHSHVQTLKPHTSSCSQQAEGGPSNDATHS